MRNDHTAGANGCATRARAASYKPLTLEDHIRLAPALYAARQAVSAAFPAFPKSGSPTREILRLQRALDDLRGVLDRQVCALAPVNRDPRGLATKIYYGAILVPHSESEDAHAGMDAFAAWAEAEEANCG